MFKRQDNQLNCFSPPVMLATLTIESCLAVYTVWRYKMDSLTRLAVLTLLTLGTFQLAEYFVCTGYGLHAEQWSRLGFVAITALPAMGIHLMHKLANQKDRKLVYGAYTVMTAFMVFFLTYKTAFIGHKCTGNYVIFQLGPVLTVLYMAYYYGLLALGIYLGVIWANRLLRQGKKGLRRLQTVRALIIGYLVFLIPVAVANTVKPSTRQGIPSIMCGFAVIYALILTFYIMPKSAKLKSYKRLNLRLN